MVTRLHITLEQREYSGLLDLAEKEMRSPADQVRFLLKQHLKKQHMLSSEAEVAGVNDSGQAKSMPKKEVLKNG